MHVVGALLIVLVVGDLGSTFFYHVPQHLWFTLHLRTHHDRRRSYWDHAVLSRDPAILLDGILGALPYLIVAAAVARLSWQGALLGLLLGQLHVWWRHTTELGWRTPRWIEAILRPLQIV
ncbi:MAG: fatty acid hydroxylase, partial [Candidatus Eremiobacteraeota bacterium]|nr:fatty acid hydroxylase [Candidatus Eremiobacteraeota bacterium]